MKVPIFLANALRNAPRINKTEPTAKHHFRPQRPFIQEAINGVIMAGRKRLAEISPRVAPEGLLKYSSHSGIAWSPFIRDASY
jgi:hypothetical protein